MATTYTTTKTGDDTDTQPHKPNPPTHNQATKGGGTSEAWDKNTQALK